MIQKQFYTTREDGVNLYITFSDEGYFIKKTNDKPAIRRKKEPILYPYAIDVESATYEYEEVDKLIEHTALQVKEMEEMGVKYWIPKPKTIIK